MDLKDTLLIGDQTVLHFKTTVPKGVKYLFPTPDNPVVQGVELVGKPQIDTLQNRGGELVLDTKVTLTSFDSGSYVLPPFPAYLSKADGTIDTVWYDGGRLEVKTIQIDTTAFKPYDIKGQQTYKYTVGEFIPWFAILLAIVALFYLGYKLFKNYKEKKSLFKKAEPLDPPHIIALRNLERIRSEKLWQNNQEKRYYTEIVDTIRQYLEQRYGIQTMEKTSAEILEMLSKFDIESKVYKELEELFHVSDLVKFAKYKATQLENEEAIPIAVRFINSTFLQGMEEDKDKNQDDQEDKERRD
jgi:hypothetical protein